MLVFYDLLEYAAVPFSVTHPLFWPYVPYWALILTLFTLSPVTLILPDLLKGKLSCPRRSSIPDEWIIHGRRYNLKSFYGQHPGGSFALRAAKGSDCTDLFESYHVFIDREVLLKMLARFEIQDENAPKREPLNAPADPFYADLKEMVREHFRPTGKGSHKMTWPHLSMVAVAWACMWVLIYHMVVNAAMWCIPFIGFLSWYLTGNAMHDGSHNALVNVPIMNRLMSNAAFPYGVNVTAWHIQHVMSHHIYTNHEEDVDLYHFKPLIDLVQRGTRTNIALHGLRLFYILSTAVAHLSVVVPYGLLTGHTNPDINTMQYGMFKSVVNHRVELRWELLAEWGLLMAFFAWTSMQMGFLAALACHMSVFAVSSYLFCFFTQVSHLQEECFPDERMKLEPSFPKRQVASSVDFNVGSAAWAHLSGGLNMQALHHCFPSVSAMHLRDMYPKFRKVCAKHDVKVKEAPTLSSFLWGFINFSN